MELSAARMMLHLVKHHHVTETDVLPQVAGLMQQSLEAETRAMFAYPVAIYEHTLTPHQAIRMHHRALPWFPDTVAITRLLGAASARWGTSRSHQLISYSWPPR